MQTIGIAGVTIPGAVDCIQKINLVSSQLFEDNAHPHLLLVQPNFAIMQAAFFEDNWDQVCSQLCHSIDILAQMGADFAIIPANTVHRVIDQVQKKAPIPVLNMLEIVSDVCKEQKIKKIGILGTTWTMSGHLYQDTLAKQGVEEVIPTAEEQSIIQHAIFYELIPTGTVKQETLVAMLTVVASLKKRGCDGIALACTELPLVLNGSNCGMPVIDTTEALARAACYALR